MPHHYRIHVEQLETAAEPQQLSFDVSIHDDIFAILQRVDGKLGFDDTQTKSFIVGLKLFGEVMLAQRKHPLFEELGPQFKLFMKKLKSGL